MYKTVFLLLFTGSGLVSLSQKSVLRYPVEFAKGTFQRKDYDSYYLNDPTSQNSLLILKDNKKAEYLLLDKNLKLASKFSPSDGLSSTVFKLQEEYIGGTAGNGKNHFAYAVLDGRKPDGIYVETVDPVSKTVSNKKMFDIPKDEKAITTFSNYGKFFSITANNNSGELMFYGMNADGKDFTKSVKVNIPEASKKKKLSEYLEDLKVINEDEEAGLESATEKVKLFYSPGKISIIINESDNPSHILNINTETFSLDEKLIDHSSMTKDEKGKSYVTSFLKDDKLFTLILNKKDIKIVVYNAADRSVINTHQISDNTDLNVFAISPTEEERMGSRMKEKNIDNVNKLIKALTKGSEGLTVRSNNANQYVLNIGTYDPIRVQTGSTGGHWAQTSSINTANPSSSTGSPGSVNSTPNYIRSQTYVPGNPIYTTALANFYKSTHFTLLVDNKSLKIVKGRVPLSVNSQIKDYLSDVNPKAEAKNQFKINDKQYFGYYDREMKMYMIEEIIIRR